MSSPDAIYQSMAGIVAMVIFMVLDFSNPNDSHLRSRNPKERWFHIVLSIVCILVYWHFPSPMLFLFLGFALVMVAFFIHYREPSASLS